MKTTLQYLVSCICVFNICGQVWAGKESPTAEKSPFGSVSVSSVRTLEKFSERTIECLSLDMEFLECDGDPIDFPWMQTLISSLVFEHCDSCLTIAEAQWNDMGVIEVNWNAGNCGFTDLGFWTVYSCSGDTLQHCETTIAGLICMPDSMTLTPEDLTDRDTIWQCAIPACVISSDSILCQAWLIDSLIANAELCEVFCIEGNSGNFVYRHDFNGQDLVEFRTTCGSIERHFFDCTGQSIFVCSAFGFGSAGLCDITSVPGLMEGELLWDCSQPIKGSTSIFDGRGEAIEVFPTIFTNSLNISINKSRLKELVITDISGRDLLRTRNLQDKMSFNTSGWSSGPYFLTFLGDGHQVIRKVFKID